MIKPLVCALALLAAGLCTARAQAVRASSGLSFAAPAVAVTDAAYLARVQQVLEAAVAPAGLSGHCTAPEVVAFPGTPAAAVVGSLNAQFGPLGYQTATLPVGVGGALSFRATKGANLLLGVVQTQGTTTALLLCPLSGPPAVGALPALPAILPTGLPAQAPAPGQAQAAPSFPTLRTQSGFDLTLQGCVARPRNQGELYKGERYNADADTELKCTFTVKNAKTTDDTFSLYGNSTKVFDDLANEIPATLMQLKDTQSPFVPSIFLVQGLSIRGSTWFYVSSSASVLKILQFNPGDGGPVLQYRDVPIVR